MLFLTIVSAILALILTPASRSLAIVWGLTDKPNHRKLHHTPVPLTGGVLVFSAVLPALLFQSAWVISQPQFLLILTGAAVLLLTGIIDDKYDIRAVYKLIIQFGIACMVWASGIHIPSMYGILGIEDLNTTQQAILTILTLTGAINAFNLWDGIDGLAGSLALVCLLLFGGLALLLGIDYLAMLLMTVSGALIIFLRNNFSQRYKMFMGDAGSMFLGFIIVVSAVLLLQSAHNTRQELPVLALVAGALALPLLDSLRVYLYRLKKGYSPFKADRSHLHHLVLSLVSGHYKATLLILGLFVLVLLSTVMLCNLFSINTALIILLILFFALTRLLHIHHDVAVWREKLRKIEH